MKTKSCKCKSGLTAWCGKICDQYQSFEEFAARRAGGLTEHPTCGRADYFEVAPDTHEIGRWRLRQVRRRFGYVIFREVNVRQFIQEQVF